MEQMPIGFALNDIDTLQFAIFPEQLNDNDDDNFGLQTDVGFGIDQEENELAVHLTLTFLQKKNVLIKIQLQLSFIIENETWDSLIKADQTITFPIGFMRHLTVISIGTIRGVLHSKLENTAFNGFILPILSVEELVKKDITFSFDEEE